MIPKFRVWDKYKGIMYAVEGIDFIELSISVRDEDVPKYFKTLYLDDSIVLMQSTGLFDKNGNEIYEGDIINCKYGICEVKYILDSYHAVKGNLSGLLGWVCDDETKIIGNICEKPELLEE